MKTAVCHTELLQYTRHQNLQRSPNCIECPSDDLRTEIKIKDVNTKLQLDGNIKMSVIQQQTHRKPVPMYWLGACLGDLDIILDLRDLATIKEINKKI
eukprot:scaffold27042_cov210-Skeletonema_menzelii.AAC.1